MDTQAVRTELKGYAPTGWQGYDYLPGSAGLPAMIVGLPETISFDGSFRFANLRLPVMMCVGPQLNRESEIKLLDQVVITAKAFPSNGTSYRSCKVVNITDFAPMEVGTIPTISATIMLELLVEL